MRPLHAPYAGRTRPFSIAMAPLGDVPWLEVDDRRKAELAEKLAIFRAGEGFAAEPGTEAAQVEAAGLIAGHLAERGLGEGLAASMPDASPLQRAALMVQDDLVLMRRGEDAWRLAAAALAFPSLWSLEEKFSQPMDDIHANVPGWAGPMGTRVARIFDTLATGAPVWRLNWSLQWGGGLRMAVAKGEAPKAQTRQGELSVRVERQTLLKLPRSGDLLFTIKVMLDPIAALARHPDGAQLLGGLAEKLAGLDADQLAYKGIVDRDGLVERIEALSRSVQAV